MDLNAIIQEIFENLILNLINQLIEYILGLLGIVLEDPV